MNHKIKKSALRHGVSVVLAAGVLVGYSVNAHAQSAAIGTPAAESGNVNGDEGAIIVTAQKRSERLVDVPLSVISTSSEQLDQRGVTNIRDISMISPSIRMDRQGNNVAPGIRGVSNVLIGASSEPNVATYVDGVYQSSSNGMFLDLPDVSRIEVLKGPQGTLFGRNATGGAIQIFTQDPSFDFTGKFSAYAGNYGLVGARGNVSVPIAQDLLAISLSGFREHSDGYSQDANHNFDRIGEQNSTRISGKILFTPSSTVRFVLGGSWSKWDSRQGVGTILNNNSIYFTQIALGTLPAGTVLALKPHQQQDDVPSKFTTTIGSVYLRGEAELPFGTLTSTTAYYKNRTDSYSDGDYGPLPLQFFRSINPVSSWSEELNFSSKRFGPFQLVAGVFYYTADAARDPSGQGGTTVGGSTTAQATAGVITLATYLRSKTRSIAGFAELTTNLSDKLKVILGGRITSEKKTAFAGRTPPLSAAPLLGEVTYHPFTPRASIQYSTSDNSNLYFTYSRGFKSGVFNEGAFSSTPILPETINSYELGYKIIAGPLAANLALFNYDYKNMQVAARIGNVIVSNNAAASKIKGVDIDASLKVSHDLNLTAGMTYLHSRYTSFTSASVTVPKFSAPGVSNGNSTVTADVSGKVLIRNPEFSWTFAANYSHELSQGNLALSASMAYSSRTYFDVSNRVSQAAYAVVNAKAAFSPKGVPGLELSVWGRNLTDTNYLNSVQFSGNGDSGQFANPRTFGAEVKYAF